MLTDCNISKCQITLDGPPHIHDARRHLNNGGKTFEAIIRNILNLLDTSIKLSIRINLDKDNANTIKELLQTEEISEITRKGAHIYSARISAKTEVCSKIQSKCLSEDEWDLKNDILHYSNISNNYYKHAIKYFYGICVGNRINGFVIAPDGTIYKCPDCLGNNEGEVGSIFSPLLMMSKNMAKWMAVDPFEEKRCIDCKYLPLCMGGCTYLRFGLSPTPIRNCITEEDVLDGLKIYICEADDEKNAIPLERR